MNTDPKKSAQNCRCDEGAGWTCEGCKIKAQGSRIQKTPDGGEILVVRAATEGLQGPGDIVHVNPQTDIAFSTADEPYIETHNAKIEGIHDSGKRQVFSSGAMRDPSEGKIKWSRITFGPMMRRWAQHLTNAEAKYPDPIPRVPNFSLIKTREEYLRYKESAMRHFMSWFNEEQDEDHASAVFFNINGVELIKDKWEKEGQQ